MTNLSARALARTLLLMRDEVGNNASDEKLLEVLNSTILVLVADKPNLASHSAQSAFVTAAMLLARSGHQVHVLAPDVQLLAQQPPLLGDRLISTLVAASDNIVPGVRIFPFPPALRPDLVIRFGDSGCRIRAHRELVLQASSWSGSVVQTGSRWPRADIAFGGLAAAALGAGEAFKSSMSKLLPLALSREQFNALFSPCLGARVDIAPADTPSPTALGKFEVISGGAIANAFLYSIARTRDATGSGRLIDFDKGDISNLNRNMLMLYSDLGAYKVDSLADHLSGGISLEPVVARFAADHRIPFRPASKVIVGVDHIPTRWAVQSCNPDWMAIGASTHWSAMASFHAPGLACARCLHPHDDPTNGPIPTVAFVSFWAGLLLAGYFARSLALRDDRSAQQTFITPLRPEQPWSTRVAHREDCKLCSEWRQASIATYCQPDASCG